MARETVMAKSTKGKVAAAALGAAAFGAGMLALRTVQIRKLRRRFYKGGNGRLDG
jgi:hypothetical protein